MNLFEYQQLAARTIPDTLDGDDLYLNAVLGVNGEAGEMADMLKKALFQGHAYTEEQKINEAGDVLWYIAAACTALGVSLETVAQANIDKLRRRYPDGFNVERSVFRDDGPASQNEIANEHYIYPQAPERITIVSSPGKMYVDPNFQPVFRYPQGQERTVLVDVNPKTPYTITTGDCRISATDRHALEDYQDGSGVE